MMNFIRRLTRSPKTLYSLCRYAINCSVVLAAKLAMMWGFLHVFHPQLAYLVVHVGTFFISYSIHARSTFKTATTKANLWGYFKAVIGFKVLDYLVFSVAFKVFEIEALWSIIVATVLILVFRFAVVRRTFLGKQDIVEART